jgi:hypothetical protein
MFSSSVTSAADFFLSDFETGAIQPRAANHDGWSAQKCCTDSIVVTDLTNKMSTRLGKNAIKFTIRLTDPRDQKLNPNVPGRPRAQLNRSKGILSEFINGKEFWTGASVFIPNDWIIDKTRHDVLFQWFQKRDICKNGVWDPTGTPEVSGSPPMQLRVEGANWVVVNRWDDRPCHTHPIQGNENLLRMPVNKGVWTDWVFRTIFSAGNDGLIQIWKDGVLVVDRIGKNTFNNKIGNRLTVGLYKAGWEKIVNSPVQKRVIYYDEIRISEATPNISIAENRKRVSPPGPKPPSSITFHK